MKKKKQQKPEPQKIQGIKGLKVDDHIYEVDDMITVTTAENTYSGRIDAVCLILFSFFNPDDRKPYIELDASEPFTSQKIKINIDDITHVEPYTKEEK